VYSAVQFYIPSYVAFGALWALPLQLGQWKRWGRSYLGPAASRERESPPQTEGGSTIECGWDASNSRPLLCASRNTRAFCLEIFELWPRCRLSCPRAMRERPLLLFPAPVCVVPSPLRDHCRTYRFPGRSRDGLRWWKERPEVAVAWRILKSLVADENFTKEPWENDSRTPPSNFTCDPRFSGNAFAAILGLIGTGLCGEYTAESSEYGMRWEAAWTFWARLQWMECACTDNAPSMSITPSA